MHIFLSFFLIFFWYLMPSWILKTFSMPFRLVLKFFLQFFRYYLAGCVDHLSGKFDLFWCPDFSCDLCYTQFLLTKFYICSRVQWNMSLAQPLFAKPLMLQRRYQAKVVFPAEFHGSINFTLRRKPFLGVMHTACCALDLHNLSLCISLHLS